MLSNHEYSIIYCYKLDNWLIAKYLCSTDKYIFIKCSFANMYHVYMYIHKIILNGYLILVLLLQYETVSFCHSFQVILLPKDLREFPSLTHLEVGLVNVGILLVLLEKTPVLKTLILKVCNY